MAKNVADCLWQMLEQAGVKRCYGIVGDALNPVIDALRRNGKIDFVHVRHEEYGTFAAVAEAALTEQPVAVCGTTGPGVAHLINGLMDARKERVPIIAICGDVDSRLMDTQTFQETNPYTFFNTVSLYTARIVTANHAQTLIQTALRTAILECGPTVISIPANMASEKVSEESYTFIKTTIPSLSPHNDDIEKVAELINSAKNIALFAGEGCKNSRDLVIQLAKIVQAPIGFTLRGKQWLEYDNSFAVGTTGMLGYGSAYDAMHEADLLIILGADFPYVEFLPDKTVKKIQIDKRAHHIGRRTHIDIVLVGDVQSTLTHLLPRIAKKEKSGFLEKHQEHNALLQKQLQHFVTKGIESTPLRPEYVIATLNELAADNALFFADTGTPCIWAARYLSASKNRRIFGSFSWGSMANAAPNAFGAQLAYPGRQTIALCGDGGFTMLGLGDILTQVRRKMPVVHLILNNGTLGYVDLEMQYYGMVPFGTTLQTPNFADVARALGAKGIRIERPDEVKSAFQEALSHTEGPVIIDVIIDPHALAIPSHIPERVARGFSTSLSLQLEQGKYNDVVKTIKYTLD